MIRQTARLGLRIIIAAALSPATIATAAVKDWTDGTGNWSMPANWSGGTVPIGGDLVNIYFTDGVARTVTYDIPAITLGSINVSLKGPGATNATLSMSANNLTVGTEYVGYDGRGTIDHSGGTNTIAAGAGSLNIGVLAGSTGTYNLSGTGALVANTDVFVGDLGTGFFNQLGGTNTIDSNGSLSLGDKPNATGSYTLNGGSLSAGRELIGASGTGIFHHTGGTNAIDGNLFLGVNSNSTGTYNLSGTGALTAGNLTIGYSGTGIFNQSGGTTTIGHLEVGFRAFSHGSLSTYNLSGGSATCVGNTIVGGYNSIGVLTVSGVGVLTVGGTLDIVTSVETSYATRLNLSGGTINIAALNVNGVPALFNWTSGKLHLTQSVTWDSAAAVHSTSAVLGSSRALGSNQTLMITGNETLGGTGAFDLTLNSGSTHNVTGTLTIATNGTLTQNASSTLYAATITQAGGAVHGTLQNQGNFIYQSGLFNGRLLNQGTVNLGPSFTAGNGVENDATMAVAGGQTLTANGAGFDNRGTLSLNDATAVLAGTTLNNTGLVRGEGRITAPFNNNAGGEVRAETGKWLKFQSAGGPNAGRISLLGGTVEFTLPFTNGAAGQILGNGTVIVGGTGLTNQGQLIFSSGTGYVFGDLNNNTGNATKGVTISGNSNVTFWDDVTHAAGSVFKVQAGSSVTFFGTLSGAGSITGGGDVYVEADLTPGSSPASVHYDADVYFNSTAQLKIELGGTTPGTEFDQLHVSGQLSLGGTLDVDFINLGAGPFAPAAGDSFDILDWGTLSGTFDTLQLPTLDGLVWNSSQLYTTGMLLVVAPGLSGDYNNNGTVDAADYVVWRKTDGTQAGYNTWRANFGQTAGSGFSTVANAAVPEPATLVMLVLAAAGVCSRRRRAE